jgi:pimeloyl-ACP methyl ester carboxylesterase
MRFDYHGTGESSGTAEAFRLHEPFAEDVTGAIEWIRGQGVERILLIGSCFGARTALAAAVSDDRLAGLILVSVPPRDFEMGERLTSRFSTELSVWQYLRRGLRARHLRGLFDSQRRAAYVRHARAKGRTLFGRFRRASGAIDRSRPDPSRISPVFVEKVGSLVDRGVPILFIYGQDEDFYEEFGRATDAGLGTKLDGAGSLVALETLPGTVHGFTRLTVQDQVADLVTRWAGRLAGVESR